MRCKQREWSRAAESNCSSQVSFLSFEKGNLSWQRAFDNLPARDKRPCLSPKGEEKIIAVFESNKILRGDTAAEGQDFKGCESCPGGNALQDNCEYNLFHYEWYPFNTYNQPFSFAFPFFELARSL